jgi:hypothetical protein
LNCPIPEKENLNASPLTIFDDFLMTLYQYPLTPKAFTRYRDKWRPGLNIEPNGLRPVLRSEWFKRRWHADSLAVYRGHKPPNASVVDWNHYIIFDPDSLQKMFREEVVEKVDEVLAPYQEQWINSTSNVVQLNSDKKKARSPVQKGPEKGPLAVIENRQSAEA